MDVSQLLRALARAAPLGIRLCPCSPMIYATGYSTLPFYEYPALLTKLPYPLQLSSILPNGEFWSIRGNSPVAAYSNRAL